MTRRSGTYPRNLPKEFGGHPDRLKRRQRPTRSGPLPRNPARASSTERGAYASPIRRNTILLRSLLQLPLQQLDLLSQRRVGVDQVLDLAHGVQHGGVVAAAEPAPDLRQ